MLEKVVVPVKGKASSRCTTGVYILAQSGDVVYNQSEVKAVLVLGSGLFRVRLPNRLFLKFLWWN